MTTISTTISTTRQFCPSSSRGGGKKISRDFIVENARRQRRLNKRRRGRRDEMIRNQAVAEPRETTVSYDEIGSDPAKRTVVILGPGGVRCPS